MAFDAETIACAQSTDLAAALLGTTVCVQELRKTAGLLVKKLDCILVPPVCLLQDEKRAYMPRVRAYPTCKYNLRHPAPADVARAQNPERNDIQEVLESLESIDFADMVDLVEHLHPLMCGYISAALEDDKPATALDMMVWCHPLSLSSNQASSWRQHTLIHDPKHTCMITTPVCLPPRNLCSPLTWVAFFEGSGCSDAL